MLWHLPNMSTFRIYDAPPRPKGDSAVFVIGPAGAAVQYPLQFRRNDLGEWLILVETEEWLRAAVNRFLSDLGHSSIEAMRNARRRSPRETMRTFLTGIHAWDAGGAERALSTLDLSFLPVHLGAAEGPILADYLKQVIDRIGYVIWQEIPDDPNRPTPYLHYRHPAGNVSIERVPGDNDSPDEWRFSARTLQAVPEIFSAIQELPLAPGIAPSEPLTRFFQIRESIRSISPNLLRRAFLLENWQWPALIAAFLAALLAA